MALGLALGFVAGSHAAERETQWIEDCARGLDPRAVETLARLHGSARQLLALRTYLRAGDELAARWSWTPAQLADYPGTEEGRTAAADIDAVERAFADANPGFTAAANRLPRSLDMQVDHWNENASVGVVALQLQTELERQSKARDPAPGSHRVCDALINWHPTVAAPLAAPGLSAHGQGRAFDFQIERNHVLVADFDANNARQQWDAQGWTSKLHAAVLASGKPFVGPLQSPYEPWHYAYLPARR